MIADEAAGRPASAGRSWRFASALLAVCGAAWPATGALAQNAAAAAAAAQRALDDVARQRVQPLPLPSPDYDFRIQSPERSAVPKAVDTVEFSVRSIRVIGAKHMPDKVVRSIFAPLEGRTIVLDDLRKAAQLLEDHYRAKGFFLTRVFVSPQQVKNGVLEVQVLEGYVDAAFVDAPNKPSRRQVEKTIGPVINEVPAQFADLESRLLIVNDTPGIAATSVLRQGAVPASSEILVTATKVPNAYRASFSNTQSDILGPTSYGIGATLSQPLGRPGLLDIDLSAAGGNLKKLRTADVRYAFPVGHNGWIMSMGALLAKAEPGGSVKALDLRSRIATFNGSLRMPLLRTRPNSIYLDIGLTVSRNKTDALGSTIVDDKSTVTSASVSWQQAGWLKGATTVNLTVSHGLTIFGANGALAPLASVQGFRPDFTKFTYSVERIQTLTERTTFKFDLQGQYTRDRLVSGELISFGGPMIGRGYDPSLIAGERGLGMIAELQWALPLKWPPSTDGLTLYSFGDWARATSLASTVGGVLMPKSTEYISSIGGGVRTIVMHRLSVDLQVADATRGVSGAARRGARFNANILLFF